MAVLYSAIIIASVLLAGATSFTITEKDPIFPIQQLLDDNTLLRILPNNENETVQCLEGTYLDKSSLTCQFENVESIEPLVTSDLCSSGEIGDFENPENCRSFVSCGAAGAYVVFCNDNLLYNKLMNQCQWPREAECCEYEEKNSSRLIQNSHQAA